MKFLDLQEQKHLKSVINLSFAISTQWFCCSKINGTEINMDWKQNIHSNYIFNYCVFLFSLTCIFDLYPSVLTTLLCTNRHLYLLYYLQLLFSFKPLIVKMLALPLQTVLYQLSETTCRLISTGVLKRLSQLDLLGIWLKFAEKLLKVQTPVRKLIQQNWDDDLFTCGHIRISNQAASVVSLIVLKPWQMSSFQ